MTQAWNVDGGIHEITLPAQVPGRLWLCGKHVLGPDPEGVLALTGATAVVCLTEEHELADRYPRYVEWLHAEQGNQGGQGGQGRRAMWLPVHDLHAPSLERGLPFVDDLAQRLRAGDGLVVHCGAGIGRAGTTAIALLVLLGEPLDRALDQVRSERPMAGPEVGSQLDFLHAIVRRTMRDTS